MQITLDHGLKTLNVLLLSNYVLHLRILRFHFLENKILKIITYICIVYVCVYGSISVALWSPSDLSIGTQFNVPDCGVLHHASQFCQQR